jgi:hypothetical protein
LQTLLGASLDQIFGFDSGETSNVVDVFLRIKRVELSADFCQRVDNFYAHLAHSSVEGAV